jgi:hypothetical protein
MAIKIATKSKLDNGVSFTFADKSSTIRTCELKELGKDMITALAIHGLSQKLGDSYSSNEGIADAIATVDQVWAQLKAGNFNARVSGSSLFYEALARIKGLSVDEVRAKVEILDEEAQDKMKSNAKVKAMMVVIRGERASSKALAEDDDLEL